MFAAKNDPTLNLVSLIKDLMRLMTLDEACRKLVLMHPVEVINKARALIEAELKQIRTLREPPGLIWTPWAGWYLGQQPTDIFWPPLKELLLHDPEWSKDAVDSVDTASTKVVSLAANPFLSEFQARGLGAWVTSNFKEYSCQYYFVFKEVFPFYKVELFSVV